MTKDRGEKYRLIALDMDGTLLMPDKSIHPDTIRDIEEAALKGIHVIYCSGRAVPEIQPYTSILTNIRYAVCMSGALIFDLKEKRSIYKKAVLYKYIPQIMEAAKEDDGMVQFMTENESIVRADQINHMEDFHIGVYKPMYLEITRRVEDMAKEAGRYESIPKVNIHFHSPEARKKAYDRLKHLPLTFAFAEASSLEMTARGVTKAEGLRILADYLGVSLKETLAIGDADNDRQVLEIAGFSVAMGNAINEIKELCDAVTEDNEHNGVGKAIQKYCLK